ncbi:MAG: hypothetical protein IJ150_03000 [Bacteroidales bacterium]|nr:hypothetical protein [Bacteroidales bacterium]
MVKVYNPIYDTVFKYLMEDDKAAKVLLGSILDKKIEVLTLKNNDYTIVTDDGMKIVRLDFCATVLDKKTQQTEVVTIELQKAFDEEEVVRFRKYLGLQYSNEANSIKITKKHRKTGEEYTLLKPMHIYAVYILGHTLGSGLEYSVLKGKYIFEDLNGQTIEIPRHHEFPNGLTHDLFIVQIPHLAAKPKKHVEKLLSIFDQRQIIDKDNPKYINIDEDRDNSDDYRTLVTRLLKGTADDDMRGKIEFEEEMERRFKRERYERAELADALKEARGMISDQHNKILEQQNQLTEQRNQLAAKDNKMAEQQKQLTEQRNQLAAKDNKMAEQQKLFVKTLQSLGQSAEQIAERLNLSVGEIKKLIEK